MRYAIALLLLCALLCGESAALTPDHQRHQSQNHSCLVCQVGSLPFLGRAIAAPSAGIVLLARLGNTDSFTAPQELRCAVRCSRAPPA